MHSVSSIYSVESDKTLTFELRSIKDLLCYLCLHGTGLAFLSLTQKPFLFLQKYLTNSVDSTKFN